MPIATNHPHSERSEYTYEYTTTLEINFSRPRLATGPHRSASALLIKPRVYCISEPAKHAFDFHDIDQHSYRFQLPYVGADGWLALAVSHEYILAGGGTSSCVRLYDLQGNQRRRVETRTRAVLDLAWSTALNAFLIASHDRLQMYHIDNHRVLTVEQAIVCDNDDEYFSSIACHRNDLFVVLSDGLKSIRRLALPDFQCVRTLSGNTIREGNSDDRIGCIRTNGYSIGMTLRQRDTGQWRVDLFDYHTMQRTHRGLTIGYSTGAFQSLERCMLAPLSDQQWLVIGGSQVEPNALTIMNERTGEIKQMERQAERRKEFISNICTHDSAQGEVLCLMTTDHRSGRCQLHVVRP